LLGEFSKLRFGAAEERASRQFQKRALIDMLAHKIGHLRVGECRDHGSAGFDIGFDVVFDVSGEFGGHKSMVSLDGGNGEEICVCVFRLTMPVMQELIQVDL
jgi:hypothetical protein